MHSGLAQASTQFLFFAAHVSEARWGPSQETLYGINYQFGLQDSCLCFVRINSTGKAQVLSYYFVLLRVTLCYIAFHDCVGRSVSGGNGWIPSWFVQSLPTSTERSQKLCGHLTTSPVWGTSTPWNELVPNIWEHLGCTCLESRSKKSKAI